MVEGIFRDTSQQVLHIGCGKSLFGEDMHLRSGYQRVLNVDYSEKLISEMNSRNKHKALTYEVQDVFEMSYQEESQTCIVDKGTLDAVFPEDTPENEEKITQLLHRLLQILTPSGNLCIISLMQSFILKAVTAFCSRHQYSLSFYEIAPEAKEDSLVPFLVRIQKSQTGEVQVVKVDGSVVAMVYSSVEGKVKQIQMQNSFVKGMKSL